MFRQKQILILVKIFATIPYQTGGNKEGRNNMIYVAHTKIVVPRPDLMLQ